MGQESLTPNDGVSCPFSLQFLRLGQFCLKLCLCYRERKLERHCQTIINSVLLSKKPSYNNENEGFFLFFLRCLCFSGRLTQYFSPQSERGTCSLVSLQDEYICFSITAAICFCHMVLIALMASLLFFCCLPFPFFQCMSLTCCQCKSFTVFFHIFIKDWTNVLYPPKPPI